MLDTMNRGKRVGLMWALYNRIVDRHRWVFRRKGLDFDVLMSRLMSLEPPGHV